MNQTMRPGSPPLPAVADASNRLMLRDGTVATLRQATPDDRAAIQRFFHDLSPESRHRRFLSLGEVSETLLDQLCATCDPTVAVTLLAWRQVMDDARPIAVASYTALASAKTAEVAFAVDDRFHGRGVATAMLERLAGIASSHGFRWFQAMTSVDNDAMLEVFRDSGFEVRSRSAQGVVDVRLDLAPSPDGIAAMEERHRVATLASMRPILRPASVAVVGVSRETGSLGRRIFDHLVTGGFAGPLYPVNPHANEIAGRACLPSARDLPTGIDLAVIAVPAEHVLGAVEDCAHAAVRSLVIISAGFAEGGDEGRRRQQAVVQLARDHGMRIVGPNGMGVINTDPDIRLNASFADQLPPHGRIALASQSGGLGLTILQLASERQIGISTFVSLGNKADVSGNDLLQYGESDPGTSVLLLYLESFGNPRRFAQLARRIGRHKPIVVIKAGRTRAGSRAAGSHTAGLASSEVAVSALFEQSGVIRAETIDEMFDVAACLDLQPLPKGARVGILTNAGGPGILAADACEAAGLLVAELSESTRAALRTHLLSQASVANPVDLVASATADQFRHATSVLMTAPEIDALVVVHTPIDPSRRSVMLNGIKTGIAAGRAAGAVDKPVLACLMTGSGQPTPLDTGTELVPTYAFPENAVRALAKASAYARWRREPAGLFWSFDEIHAGEARALCREIVAARGDTWLTDEELGRVLNAFGLPMAAGAIARSEDEAAAIAAIFGFPVVLKLAAPQILHKTEANVVRLNLTTERAVRAAFTDIARTVAASRKPAPVGNLGVLIQPMFTGVETLVGLKEDPNFGPLVAFGLGGVSVEVLRDVAFRIAPLTDRDADALLHGIRGFQLLQGYRGRPASDVEALREVLLRVSLIGQHVPEIVELDLNPVIALPDGHGCRIVDARARVASTAPVPGTVPARTGG
ncbi:MAG: GNAT family N-acetyltransferase [Vicinamibacterales bacterium]